MKFSTSTLSSVLLATAALAAPARMHRRSRSLASRQESFNNIWGGAVIGPPPPSGNLTQASGQYVLPQASLPGNGQTGTQYGVAFWVGIGDSTILQSGVDSIVDENGNPGYQAWYEFFPDPSGDLDTSGLNLNAGDTIEVNIQMPADESDSGTVTINNLSQGTSASQSLPAPSGVPLDYSQAEWIAEDYSVNGGDIGFANFGSVTFTSCSASTADGTTLDLGSAHVTDIDQNNDILTQSTINSNSQVTIQYTGP